MKAFDTIEAALAALRAGRLILVTDDEDRENEGDLICAAAFATTENVNFMAVHGKGRRHHDAEAHDLIHIRYQRFPAIHN